MLNDTWLFLIWCSDHSSFPTNSACSRWPIAVIPKSLYLMDNETGINLTVAAATAEIAKSLQKLSTSGVKLRDVPSMGSCTETRFCLEQSFLLSFPQIKQPVSILSFSIQRFPRLDASRCSAWGIVRTGRHMSRCSTWNGTMVMIRSGMDFKKTWFVGLYIICLCI